MDCSENEPVLMAMGMAYSMVLLKFTCDRVYDLYKGLNNAYEHFEAVGKNLIRRNKSYHYDTERLLKEIHTKLNCSSPIRQRYGGRHCRNLRDLFTESDDQNADIETQIATLTSNIEQRFRITGEKLEFIKEKIVELVGEEGPGEEVE